MAKLTKRRARKIRAEATPSLSWGKAHDFAPVYYVGVGDYSLALSPAEMARLAAWAIEKDPKLVAEAMAARPVAAYIPEDRRRQEETRDRRAACLLAET